MNALVTSSIRIDLEVGPDVGSSTMEFTPSLDTKMYILSSQQEAAKKITTLDTVDSLYPHDILSQLRQVRSKFTENIGYMSLRASSPITNYHNLKPYTIWTLSNYDDSLTSPSAAKIGSRLFQLIARYNLNRYVVKKSDVEELWEKCGDGKIKNLLKLIIVESFNDSDNLILKGNKKLEHQLQEIFIAVSSTINTVNKKTAERILELFKGETHRKRKDSYASLIIFMSLLICASNSRRLIFKIFAASKVILHSTLQKIYRIAFQIFTCESNSKVIRDVEIESFCDAVASQFKKVIHNNTLNDEISRKRIEKYAEDGVSFAGNFKRRCIGEGESVCVTPIQTTESKDLIFVKESMKQNQGKMKWSPCYDKGIKKGLFGRFASYSTLKMAFHRHTL
ncbi:hypothetical protein MFLAVUS_000068 [Mucor flavus]|uniref:Uncharacterized protein n=1 Tax=Mucor flavus TaxID=439312 RepID=A0ABP9YIN7_9FUNG